MSSITSSNKFAALLTIATSSFVAQTLLAQSVCADFGAKAPPGVTLKTQLITADTARPPGTTAGPTLAAHCIVDGQMNHRTGIDGKPYHTGFQLRFPATWNGRLLYQGGGGNDGMVRPAVGPQATDGYALNKGFAVVTTDAGHQGPTADFGFDPQARVDNAYAAHDRVFVMARELVTRYYGKPQDKSYFIGCSGGGRQGMMFTQKFPQHFDGVIAMAPAMRVSKGATIAAAYDTQQFQAIAPPNAAGVPILANAMSDADLALVRKGILDKCDADDGAVDGLVSNPAACKFDVKALQCGGDKAASCLAPAQVNALEAVMRGARNTNGYELYASWPWDAGLGHPANDWRRWKLGTSQTDKPDSRHVFLMQDALQGYFVTPPDRSLTVFNFDFDKDPARMDAHSWIFDTAVDDKLTAFKARGGKLLFAHGMADPIFSAHEMVDYYQRLDANHAGRASEFSRLFLIPGMGHCSGGAATDVWDGLSSLVQWVEQGIAPESITAKGSTVFPNRSRPLCAYPKYAHFNGSGSMEDAANFSCR